MLAFAEVKPPCPRSPLAVRLSTIWGSLRAFAHSGRSPHFEIGSSLAASAARRARVDGLLYEIEDRTHGRTRKQPHRHHRRRRHRLQHRVSPRQARRARRRAARAVAADARRDVARRGAGRAAAQQQQSDAPHALLGRAVRASSRPKRARRPAGMAWAACASLRRRRAGRSSSVRQRWPRASAFTSSSFPRDKRKSCFRCSSRAASSAPRGSKATATSIRRASPMRTPQVPAPAACKSSRTSSSPRSKSADAGSPAS